MRGTTVRGQHSLASLRQTHSSPSHTFRTQRAKRSVHTSSTRVTSQGKSSLTSLMGPARQRQRGRARRRLRPHITQHCLERPVAHPKLPTPLPLRNARSTSCDPSQTCRGQLRSIKEGVACARRATRVAHRRLTGIVRHVLILTLESLCLCAHGSAERRKRAIVASHITLDTS